MLKLAGTLAKAALAASLCAVSATATANASVSTAPAARSTSTLAAMPSNPWLTLSAMTTNSSAAANAAAAPGDSRVGNPPIASLAVILATIATAVYILLMDDDGDLDLKLPVSPA